MQKKLIALAVASVFAAPAFAATANVDVYGNLTVSYDYINQDIAGADKLSRISSNSSRIGFKGSEDLGGGLSAIWQVENQFNIEGNGGNGVVTSGSSFTSGLRNSFVGLKSASMGTALLGIHDTPYKMASIKAQFWGDTAADYNNIVGNVQGSTHFELRTSNTAAYISPSFSGVSAGIAYVMGNELGNGNGGNASALSGMIMYDQGPLFLSAAYEKHNNLGGTASTAGSAPTNRTIRCLDTDSTNGGVVDISDFASTFTVTYPRGTSTDAAQCAAGGGGGVPAVMVEIITPGTAAVGPVAAYGGYDRDAWKLSGAYTFGNTKLGLIYEKADNAAGTADRKAWYLNGMHTMGNIALKASYGRAGDLSGSSNTGANTYALGADYNLSKRSTLYAQYVKMNNDTAGTYTANANQGSNVAAGAGTDPSVFSIGMRHTF